MKIARCNMGASIRRLIDGVFAGRQIPDGWVAGLTISRFLLKKRQCPRNQIPCWEWVTIVDTFGYASRSYMFATGDSIFWTIPHGVKERGWRVSDLHTYLREGSGKLSLLGRASFA